MLSLALSGPAESEILSGLEPTRWAGLVSQWFRRWIRLFYLFIWVLLSSTEVLCVSCSFPRGEREKEMVILTSLVNVMFRGKYGLSSTKAYYYASNPTTNGHKGEFQITL
ncbi:hypothetical protein TNIN_273691 [Trichonephila inaurata madagascariensis]|uniref:Uncharacterized protein n=1 Tax=Trichonephila inaurata madagascariensis TaxID=2747483 RepID=A0A8X6X6K0_9ARAC|nr:hypothetical protein TNIN_273691 [Trichonephila inaurata madagascariensis]